MSERQLAVKMFHEHVALYRKVNTTFLLDYYREDTSSRTIVIDSTTHLSIPLVFPVPKLAQSLSKLTVRFTVACSQYSAKNYCYETNLRKGANVIATVMLDSILASPVSVRKFVFWFDRASENLNFTICVAAALFVHWGLADIIEIKFFVTGHSHTVNDGVQGQLVGHIRYLARHNLCVLSLREFVELSSTENWLLFHPGHSSTHHLPPRDVKLCVLCICVSVLRVCFLRAHPIPATLQAGQLDR